MNFLINYNFYLLKNKVKLGLTLNQRIALLPYKYNFMKFIFLLLVASSLSWANAEQVVSRQEEKKDQFNLMSYNPIYLLYNPHKTKGQASFKYKLHQKLNWYLGYNQLLMWDLSAQSRPILDNNYNPELFYRWTAPDKNSRYFFDLIPYGHLSNGKGSNESRSLNYTAVQLAFKDYFAQDIIIRTSLRLRYMYDLDLSNKDIRKYNGPAELRFSLIGFKQGFIDKGELSARFYSGGDFGQDLSKGGQEIGFSFRFLGIDITPHFTFNTFMVTQKPFAIMIKENILLEQDLCYKVKKNILLPIKIYLVHYGKIYLYTTSYSSPRNNKCLAT